MCQIKVLLKKYIFRQEGQLPSAGKTLIAPFSPPLITIAPAAAGRSRGKTPVARSIDPRVRAAAAAPEGISGVIAQTPTEPDQSSQESIFRF